MWVKPRQLTVAGLPSPRRLRNAARCGDLAAPGQHLPALRLRPVGTAMAATPGPRRRHPGAVISPLLANIYLHYVFDLWAQQWRQRLARGDVILVRYADDTVVGFEHSAEAERFLTDLRERMAAFGLTLHPEKTRLIEFGRHAAAN